MRVVHVITSLLTGGAEMMLFKLLSITPAARQSAAVVCLGPGGPVADRIRALGVEVVTLGMSPGLRALPRVGSVHFAVRRLEADVVLAWMYHANLAVSMLPPGWLGRIDRPVLWNVRGALDDRGEEKALTRLVVRAGALLSWHPARIVYNSRVAARQHEQIGYAPAKTVIIPNGFDTTLFRPDPGVRETLRREWSAGPATLVVGHVARYHPMKDHAGFLDAAARLRSGRTDVRLVLAGRNVDASNVALQRDVERSGLADRVVLLGERRDTQRLYAAFDLFVMSSSRQEGYPNVLGEAMACEVPCVATDVGDAADIVADTGRVVPPRDPVALAEALAELGRLSIDERRELGARARQRVIDNYSLPKVAAAYAALYRSVVPHSSDGWAQR